MPEPEEPTEPSVASTDPTGQVFVAADDTPPEAADAGEEPRPSAIRTATVISGRIVLGCVTLGVIGVLVAAAVLIPIRTVGASPVSRVVVPAATGQQLVCPGGLLRLGSSSGANATTASSLGAAHVTSGALGGAVQSSEFADTDAGTAHTTAAPRLLATPPAASAGTPTRLSGAQSQHLTTPDFVGLAAAACSTASAGTWLPGGSTAVGRTTLLLLANPTAVPATVSLQVFGEVGQVSAPGMDGIVVAPGAQRVLSIAGFAPNVESPVVHVTSAGGQVVAVLEQSIVRGLEPGGVDFIAGAAQPLATTVIPGVVISGTAALQSQLGQSGFDDLQTTLRLFLPGAKSTTVSIAVLAEDGSVAAKPMTAKVDGGRVTDLPLDSLSDGDYTIVVTSPRPVVASVRVSTASSDATSPSTDFAWITAAPLLTSSSLVSAATGMSPVLHLENPTDATETVDVAALDGASLSATVDAHSATSVPLSAGTTYELSGFSKLYASVSGTRDGGVASYVVSPPARGESSLRIYG